MISTYCRTTTITSITTIAVTSVPLVSLATNVNVLELGIETISYSWFKTAAVIFPPKVAASLNVTKSPATAPWEVSVAVIVELPLVAAKVASPVTVERMGVISKNVWPIKR